jgi:uncharacterized protein (TIGR00251 family)
LAPSSDPRSDFLTCDIKHQRVFLNVHLQPGAKSNALAGLHGGALKIRIAAPAADNKANAALVVFLSKLLDVTATSISIRSGVHSRRKRLEIAGAADHIAARLQAAIANG